MILTERHFHKGNEKIIQLCTLSKELYNRTNYLIRQAWFNNQEFQAEILLVRKLKNLNCYKNLHNGKTAKQTVRKCLMDWGNFLKALKSYKKDKSKFKNCPKPPKYKKELNQVIFYNETIKNGKKNKYITEITPTNNLFTIPYKRNHNFKQVVVTPKKFGFIIEVQYEQEITNKNLDKTKICTIDLGLNNLCAITLDQSRPILINGRIVKSINQYYNKYKNKKNLRKRYFRIENYFHHTSKYIIDQCVKNNIGTIIIGNNQGWKQKIKLGKRTNQNFVYIPFDNLIQKIKYKAELIGIEVILTEEAYTSKASFYDSDLIPKYGESIPGFSGKRIKRGLYLTKDNFAVNADINGSMNIGRKVIPEFYGIRDRSLAARPIVINPLKVVR